MDKLEFAMEVAFLRAILYDEVPVEGSILFKVLTQLWLIELNGFNPNTVNSSIKLASNLLRENPDKGDIIPPISMLIALVLADKSDSSIDAYLKGIQDNQAIMLTLAFR